MSDQTDMDRHRALLGALPIALSPMFDPFVQLLLDLGIPPERLGSFAIRTLDGQADPRLRLLAIPFPTENDALMFVVRVMGEAYQRHDVEQLLPKIGPAQCIRLVDTFLLFWFGVIGVELTIH